MIWMTIWKETSVSGGPPFFPVTHVNVELCAYKPLLVKDGFRQHCVKLISSMQKLNTRLFPTLTKTLFIKSGSNIEFFWQLPTPLGRERFFFFPQPVAMVILCNLRSIEEGFLGPDARASLWVTDFWLWNGPRRLLSLLTLMLGKQNWI